MGSGARSVILYLFNKPRLSFFFFSFINLLNKYRIQCNDIVDDLFMHKNKLRKFVIL